MRPVDVFHIGPQKAATTWAYFCLREHPEIAAPERDTIHYFDMHYARGRGWYESWFRHAEPGQKLFDPSYTYIRSPWAAERIAKENPDAKIVLCMREPIERAFSHYWHEKKQGRTSYEFGDILKVYDLYSSWLEPGFYAKHIRRYLDHFPREQLLCLLFDDLAADPRAFYRQITEFIGVDPEHEPSVLQDKINVAGPRMVYWSLAMNRAQLALERLGLVRPLQKFGVARGLLSGKSEYLQGIPEDLREALAEICEPEIAELERLLDLDLSGWRTARELPEASRAAFVPVPKID